MPKTCLCRILTANVIEARYDVERFSLDWTRVKIGEIVHVIDTGHFYVIKDLEELDNENGYFQLDGGPGGSVSSVGLAMPMGFTVSNSPVVNTGVLTVTTTLSGIVKGNGSGFLAAIAGTDYENPLTFSGGVTRAANSVTVDTTLPLVRLSSISTNGFLKVGGGNGTLSVDTSTYLTASTGVTSISGTSNEISASAGVGAVTLSLPTTLTFTGKTVTGGTFNSGVFNGSIGSVSPSTGSFTSVTANAAITQNSGGIITALTSGGGSGVVGTISNHSLIIAVNNVQVGLFTPTGLNSTPIGAGSASTGSFAGFSASSLSTLSGTGVTLTSSATSPSLVLSRSGNYQSTYRSDGVAMVDSFGANTFSFLDNGSGRVDLTVNGSAALARGASFTTSVSATQGSISYNSIRGLQLQGKTGSSFDFVLFSAAGLQAVTVPTGTNNVLFGGDITGLNASFKGAFFNDPTAAANTQIYVQDGDATGLAGLSRIIFIDSASSPGGEVTHLGPLATPFGGALAGGMLIAGSSSVSLSVGSVAKLRLSSSAVTSFAKLVTLASATSGAGLNLPHGVDPTSPVDGDMWSTTAGLFIRINGVTKTVTLT